MSEPMLSVRVVNVIPTQYEAVIAGIDDGSSEWEVKNSSLFTDAVELQMDMLGKKWAKLTEGGLGFDPRYIITDQPILKISARPGGYEISRPRVSELAGEEHMGQRYPIFVWPFFSKEVYARMDPRRRALAHTTGEEMRVSWLPSAAGIKVPVAGFRHGVCPAFRRCLNEALRWCGVDDANLHPPGASEDDARFRSSHFASLLTEAVLADLRQILQAGE